MPGPPTARHAPEPPARDLPAPAGPLARPADAPGAILLDMLTLFVFPLYLLSVWVPRGPAAWVLALLALIVAALAWFVVRKRQRGQSPDNRTLAALAFDALALALLMWLLADHVPHQSFIYTFLIALSAVCGTLYAYSMMTMPRRAARSWLPDWRR